MPRRDQLTYDVGPPPRRAVPWLSLLVLAAVVAVLSVLVTLVVVGDREPQAQPEPTSVTSTAPSVEPATASPLPSGSDAGEGLAVPEGSQQAASRFVGAWLDRNPKTRKAALTEVSAPGLVEELMLTNPSNIPKASPQGPPVLDDASAYSVQFTQTLTGGMRIAIYLVADPEARYSWLATSVEQA
jgi:cytoskeletal protein RodZ